MSRHDHDHVHAEEDFEVEIFQPATIFDALHLGEGVSGGFDAVTIRLDGTLKSDLSWKKEREAAENYIKSGYRIFWEMDLGLFAFLKHPLENQTQFLSLSLSLEHFRDTLWKDFRKNTVGLCLYRGPLAYDQAFRWSEAQQSNFQAWLHDVYSTVNDLNSELGTHFKAFSEIYPEELMKNPIGKKMVNLFCRDAAGEYLDLLANRLPDSLECFILVEADPTTQTPLQIAQQLTKERYRKIHIAARHAECLGGELAWDEPKKAYGFIGRDAKISLEPYLKLALGVCLPSLQYIKPMDNQPLEEVLNVLMGKGIPFKVIPESYLTTEWEGLDFILTLSSSITKQGFRKLQGFCAAGGTVITLGAMLGLSQEITFLEWCK